MEPFGQALGLGAIGLAAGVLGAMVAAFATRSQTSTLTVIARRLLPRA